MVNYSIQHKIRHGGAWAKANSKADVAHFFRSNPQSDNSMISLCWNRVAVLDNAVAADHTLCCLACLVLEDMHKGDLSNKP
jgi:hypothetical protein